MFRIILLILLLLPNIASSQVIHDRNYSDSFHYSHPIKMEHGIALITGYRMSKYHFGEIGIGYISDGVAGTHPSTIIIGLSNELKLHKTLFGDKS